MPITTQQKSELVSRACEARAHAYAPYSRYAVGAALLTRGGRIYTGVNVESAAYPTGVCAERTAVFKAVSEGERDFLAMAVASENGGSPCGACRQVISEFGLETLVLVANARGEVLHEASIGELLPFAFGPQDLNKR